MYISLRIFRECVRFTTKRSLRFNVMPVNRNANFSCQSSIERTPKWKFCLCDVTTIVCVLCLRTKREEKIPFYRCKTLSIVVRLFRVCPSCLQFESQKKWFALVMITQCHCTEDEWGRGWAEDGSIEKREWQAECKPKCGRICSSGTYSVLDLERILLLL